MIVVTTDNVPARLEGISFKDILKREYRKALMHATMSLFRHTCLNHVIVLYMSCDRVLIIK